MEISHILKRKGLTKTELALRLGIANQNVNKTLNNPTEATIRKIAEALEVSIGELFEGAELAQDFSAVGVSEASCPHCGKPISIHTELKRDPRRIVGSA